MDRHDWSCRGGGGGIVKINPDTILQPPPRQNRFTVIAAVCGDLNSDVKYIIQKIKYSYLHIYYFLEILSLKINDSFKVYKILW